MEASQERPFFVAQTAQNSVTADRGLTNEQLNKMASNLSTQGASVVTALNALAAAIQAKASA